MGAGNFHLLDTVAGSARRLPLNWGMAARLVAGLASGANVLLLAFWPAKLADGTLYTQEELEQMDESATRVRFQLYEDDDGRLQVAGYHTGENSSYGDRVKVVKATAMGERFEVAVDDDLTLVWYPDESGNSPRTNTAFPADTGIDPFSILVLPIEENGQEINPPVYPNPAEEQVELIVTFPADSGIEPLYLVFRNTARNESGVVTGYGEDVTGIWLEQASEGLGAPVPSQIADRLRGREFSSFDKFREAFWLEVSQDKSLSQQFPENALSTMSNGRAPFCRKKDRVGGRVKIELHHVDEIRNGGKVYDIDNLRLVTPKNHIHLHQRGMSQ
ncbi:S-type Pyocin [Marinobacter halodurans]|uniref:S-type Pyocin n=1 Tax=Marinobacter halodurans TaxID=2528979 RepID=A0ABY1ZHA0_9GAMM|nr:S-type pyocin domain-containing protein [Marinobacter halodurans]TBW46427.1 S-type Pyocin [Marinobacter halodurans]